MNVCFKFLDRTLFLNGCECVGDDFGFAQVEGDGEG